MRGGIGVEVPLTVVGKQVDEVCALGEPKRFQGMILVATTHPRDFDISTFQGEAVKVYGTEDRVAPPAKSDANKNLLPAKTKWVRIEGGNHARFGSYGVKPGDGPAKISEEKQRRETTEAIAETLQRALTISAAASGEVIVSVA